MARRYDGIYGYVAGDPLSRVDPSSLEPVITHYVDAPKPSGMSADDYAAYGRVAGMNQRTCDELQACKARLAQEAEKRAFDVRLAAMVDAMRAAARARAEVPNVLWDAVTHPRVRPDDFRSYDCRGCGLRPRCCRWSSGRRCCWNGYGWCSWRRRRRSGGGRRRRVGGRYGWDGGRRCHRMCRRNLEYGVRYSADRLSR